MLDRVVFVAISPNFMWTLQPQFGMYQLIKMCFGLFEDYASVALKPRRERAANSALSVT